MRVLHVFDQYKSGGFERHIDAILLEFQARGIEQYAYGGPDVSRSPAASCLRRHERGAMLVESALDDAVRIERLIRSEGIDAVHAHPFYGFLAGGAGALLAGVPYVLTFHGRPPRTELEERFGPGYFRCIEHLIAPNAAAMSAVSELTRELIVRELGIPMQAIEIIRNPVRPSKPGGPPVAYRAVLVSRLDRDKESSCRSALELFAHLQRGDSRWCFEVCGDGECRERLEDYSRAAGIDRIDWVGEVADATPYMRRSSLVAGMGRVILEAAAEGRTVVLTGHDGLKGVVTEQNFRHFRESNFTARGHSQAEPAEVVRSLGKQRDPEALAALVRREHNAAAIAGQYLGLLRKPAHPAGIRSEEIADALRRVRREKRAHGGWWPLRALRAVYVLLFRRGRQGRRELAARLIR